MELSGFSLSVLAAAGGVAFLHTLLGPDHYLPFIVLARARSWSKTRTLVVTTICGLGHVRQIGWWGWGVVIWIEEGLGRFKLGEPPPGQGLYHQRMPADGGLQFLGYLYILGVDPVFHVHLLA